MHMIYYFNLYYFISIGHCTYQYNTNISVRVGSTFKEFGGEVYNITTIINYPFFDILKLNYDFAILKPDREIKYDYVNVRPISLSVQNQTIAENTTCTVSGWGEKRDADDVKEEGFSFSILFVHKIKIT